MDRFNIYQYLGKVLPPPHEIIVEEVFLDKWWQPASEPARIKHPILPYLYNVFAQTHTPIEELELHGKWGAIYDPIVWDKEHKEYQYPSHFYYTEPIIAGEKLEWFFQEQEFIWDKEHREYQFPAHFYYPEPIFAGEKLEWYFQEQEYIYDIPREQFAYPTHFFAPEPIFAGEQLEWFNQEPEFVWDKKHWEFLFPVIAQTHVPKEDLQSIGKWGAVYDNIIWDKKHWEFTNPYFFHSGTPLEEIENIGQWSAIYEDIIWDKKRWQHTYPSLFFYSEPIEAGEQLQWYFQEQEYIWDIPREQWEYPSLFQTLTPKEELEVVGRWGAFYQDFVWDKNHKEFQFPSFHPSNTPNEEIEAVGKWSVEFPDFARQKEQRQWQFPFISFAPEPITGGEQLEWFQQEIEQTWDKKRFQFQWPFAFQTILPKDELELAGRWGAKYPDFARVREKRQYQWPFLSFNPEPIEGIAETFIAALQSHYPALLPRKALNYYNYPATSGIVDSGAVPRRLLMGVGV